MDGKSKMSNVSGAIIFILGFFFLRAAECRTPANRGTVKYSALSCRKHSALLTDFGAVGDGKTSNTKAFKAAIDHLSQCASDGGAQLIVPPGKWLTGSFNLTSHFTLFLHKDAVILATQKIQTQDRTCKRFTPFGGGSRCCPGSELGKLEALQFFSNTLYRISGGGLRMMTNP
ncbi:PREDICTED: probable polygalacturonase [Prunus mume]|uniref:Probable polygalacturonase n=1 Tax=Prunus mume TaxID=102107 RepID=A0ABM1LPI9_PRUMU|nr:PREDICTED: probable polygalacturonase [Prunus mume]